MGKLITFVSSLDIKYGPSIRDKHKRAKRMFFFSLSPFVH